jgi:hypothetical protein
MDGHDERTVDMITLEVNRRKLHSEAWSQLLDGFKLTRCWQVCNYHNFSCRARRANLRRQNAAKIGLIDQLIRWRVPNDPAAQSATCRHACVQIDDDLLRYKRSLTSRVFAECAQLLWVSRSRWSILSEYFNFA